MGEIFCFKSVSHAVYFEATSKLSFKTLAICSVIKNNKFMLAMLLLFSQGKFTKCKRRNREPYMLLLPLIKLVEEQINRTVQCYRYSHICFKHFFKT